MQAIDVIYLYEHVARELDVACAVKCIAEQRYGIRIELVQWPSGLSRAYRQFRPRLVVLSHCYSAEDYQSLLLEWRKSFFINLAWEQFFSEGTRGPKTPSDNFARQHVIHHAWSDQFARYLQEQSVCKENIFINGHPAYMLYNEPYCRYFKQRHDLANHYHLHADRRWIFFPENFGWAFYSDDRVEEWVQRGTPRDHAYAMRQFARLSLEKAMQWCVAIASHNDVELIIRPRPATPLEDFKAAMRQIIGSIPERMHCIKQDSVREWIMASDVVISSYSSSLIEAALAGKAAFMLEPYSIPQFLHVDWHDYIAHIKTQNECMNVCVNGSATTDDNRLANWARTMVLAHGDAIRNLADFLAKIFLDKFPPPSFPSRKTVTKLGRFRLPKWALYEYRKIKYRKIRRQTAKTLRIHENDHISQGEIAQRINKWKQLLACYDENKKPTNMQITIDC